MRICWMLLLIAEASAFSPSAHPLSLSSHQSLRKSAFSNSLRPAAAETLSPLTLSSSPRRTPSVREAVSSSGHLPFSPKMSSITSEDRQLMRRALELARMGEGKTFPNPAVGCVIAKGGKIIGEGYHPKAGRAHAEVYALFMAGSDAEGATAYVTLEPCNHHGRTPPCSQALVQAKVSRVVVAMLDPNPLVNSSGIATLEKAGITVDILDGQEAEDSRTMNLDFIDRMVSQKAQPASPADEIWGGPYAQEAKFGAEIVQKAVEVCLALQKDQSEFGLESGDSTERFGVSVDKSAIASGKAAVKDDATPVTVADLAIQSITEQWLNKFFPSDNFMAEEDAGQLRAGDEVFSQMVASIVNKYAPHKMTTEEIVESIDRGGNEAGSQKERYWVLDPIDGTKGLMTGKGYIVGLALIEEGRPVVGVMGNPSAHPEACIMVGVKGQGIRYWPKEGEGPKGHILSQEENCRRCWDQREYPNMADSTQSEGQRRMGVDYPPWLTSRPMDEFSPLPFGPCAPPEEICCGGLIKYWAVAQNMVSGFLMIGSQLKTWDHAAGVLCVKESGGRASDASGADVLMDGRSFTVDEGIVAIAESCPEEIGLRLQSSIRKG